jgi:hypothetical protein
MQVGDLVRLRHIDSSWGELALITKIDITKMGTGQISMITKASPKCSIPWVRRRAYIEEVVSEGR